MSTNDEVLFNFNEDQEPLVNNYSCSDKQYIYINDLNQYNYANGWINFTNVNIIGNVTEKFLDWSQAYEVIPIENTLTISAGNTFAPTWENAAAVSLKAVHHLLDLANIRYNGVTINRGSYGVNLLANEKFKKMSADEYRLVGDLMNHAWDSADSYSAVPDNIILESNNDLVPPAVGAGAAAGDAVSAYGRYRGGVNKGAFINEGLQTRIGKYNAEPTSSANNNYAKVFYSDAQFTDCAQSYCVTDLTQANLTSITFRYIVHIPLCKVHDFFQQMPAVGNAQGFELRQQLNCASNNSWKLSYNNASPPVLTNISSNQSVGRTCPWLVASPTRVTVNGGNVTGAVGSGLAVVAGAGFDLTLTSQIGWGTGGTSSPFPARIYVPLINYTPSLTQMLLSQPKFDVLYNDYYIDTILNKAGGSQITQLFSAQLSRPRTLYIIPFFSTSNVAGAITPIQSPISSAPTTCSLCRISNCQIQIGGMNIFMEAQQYNFQFYQNQMMQLMANLNGNSLKSKFFSGQITKTMWEKAYNVFVFDMQKVTDEVQDNVIKNFQLQFKVNAKDTVKYDFYVIMEYQSSLTIDKITGEVIPSNA